MPPNMSLESSSLVTDQFLSQHYLPIVNIQIFINDAGTDEGQSINVPDLVQLTGQHDIVAFDNVGGGIANAVGSIANAVGGIGADGIVAHVATFLTTASQLRSNIWVGVLPNGKINNDLSVSTLSTSGAPPSSPSLSSTTSITATIFILILLFFFGLYPNIIIVKPHDIKWLIREPGNIDNNSSIEKYYRCNGPIVIIKIYRYQIVSPQQIQTIATNNNNNSHCMHFVYPLLNYVSASTSGSNNSSTSVTSNTLRHYLACSYVVSQYQRVRSLAEELSIKFGKSLEEIRLWMRYNDVRD
ncbi:unnamed protein product [Rotaria sp. Silwood2]|nr:unnamed protein product [Rotaria sp. Silwood2]